MQCFAVTPEHGIEKVKFDEPLVVFSPVAPAERVHHVHIKVVLGAVIRATVTLSSQTWFP